MFRMTRKLMMIAAAAAHWRPRLRTLQVLTVTGAATRHGGTALTDG